MIGHKVEHGRVRGQKETCRSWAFYTYEIFYRDYWWDIDEEDVDDLIAVLQELRQVDEHSS